MKFRIWDKKEKKYRDDLFLSQDNSLIYANSLSESEIEDIQKTFGRYQIEYGIEVKGLELYENDIVKMKNLGDIEYTEIVDFDETQGTFFVGEQLIEDIFRYDKLEIIGNINEEIK